MCGIAGYFNPDQNYAENPKQNFHTLSRMINTMNHRGPDTYGHTIINSCCLAHTRLSIIDLENGRQPMSYTKDGNTYYIVYNGEIYNYKALTAELTALGHTFATRTDTEVLRSVITDRALSKNYTVSSQSPSTTACEIHSTSTVTASVSNHFIIRRPAIHSCSPRGLIHCLNTRACVHAST